jgi:8-oxo-dGTP diphosphatase
MKSYVCGFAFSKDKRNVLLIKKNRPDWQKGLFNGIGGHIENGETPSQAMVREFCEEAGYKTYSDSWIPLIKILDSSIFHEWEVYFFFTFQDIECCRTMTDEEIIIIPVEDLFQYTIIKNLKWLIPMALDKDLKEIFY